jgi:hypothetical protein
MMKALLAVEPSQVSAGAIRLYKQVYFPPHADVFLLYVTPLHQLMMNYVKGRILKRFQFEKLLKKRHKHRFVSSWKRRRNVYITRRVMSTTPPKKAIRERKFDNLFMPKA